MPSGSSESNRLAGRAKLLVKVAVSLGLLVFLLRRADLGETAEFVAGADPAWVLAAWLAYLAAQVLAACKWRLLARAVGFRGAISEFVRFSFIGVFFNAFGFGTVGGDLIRALYLAGPGGRRALALNTVVADRVSGLLVLLAIALVALVTFRGYDLPAVLYWTTLLLSAGLLAGWRLAPRLLPLALREDNRLRRLVEQDLRPYWNDFGLLGRVAAISLVFHLTQIGVAVCLTRALGIEVPGSYFFIFSPLVNILAAIPVSLNGLGVREGGYVFFLSHIGVDAESAIGFALAWFAVVLASGLVGGVAYLASRASRPPGVDGATPRSSDGEAHSPATKSRSSTSR